MSSDTILVIRGTLDWAKIVGKARKYTGNPKFDKGPEWTMDMTPNAEGKKALLALGLKKKFREPGEKDSRTEDYISFRVTENKANGEKNQPPKITNVRGEPWGSDLIGNGSVADVKIRVVDYGEGSQKGMYLQAVRVLDLVSYNIEAFPPLAEDDEYFLPEEESEAGTDGSFEDDFNIEKTERNIDDLDDEIPV